MAVYENGEGVGHAEFVRRVETLVKIASAGETAITGLGISDHLDGYLFDVYRAAQEGGDVTAAADKAWIEFYNQFPTGS